MAVQNVYLFKLMLHFNFLNLSSIFFTNSLYLEPFLFPKSRITFLNTIKAFFSEKIIFSNISFLVSNLIWSLIKTPFLIFVSLRWRDYAGDCAEKVEAISFFVKSLYKFMRSNFMCSRDSWTLAGLTNGSCITFFVPGSKLVLAFRFLFVQWSSVVLLSHLHKNMEIWHKFAVDLGA